MPDLFSPQVIFTCIDDRMGAPEPPMHQTLNVSKQLLGKGVVTGVQHMVPNICQEMQHVSRLHVCDRIG